MSREVEDEIRAYLHASLGLAEVDELATDASLWSLIESIQVLYLVEYLERRFEVRLDTLRFTPEHLGTIGRMATLFANLRDVAARR